MQWGWQHKYGLQELADDMLCKLAVKYGLPLPAGLTNQQAPVDSRTPPPNGNTDLAAAVGAAVVAATI